METLSIYLIISFVAISLATILIFLKASSWSKTAIVIIAAWMIIQTIVSMSGFYLVTDSIPPRFALLLGPPVVFIISLFFTKNGRRFIDSLNIRWLTILHSIRVAVELILFGLFLQKLIPGIMTFEGRNLDILSGLSAPLVYYLFFSKQKLNKLILLLWNFVCLGLLINIVTIAILAAPFPFQRLAFDQPNIGVLIFPFTWLPCCVVPLVFFSHLASIRKLILAINKQRVSQVVVLR